MAVHLQMQRVLLVLPIQEVVAAAVEIILLQQMAAQAAQAS
jgi:hypothetical protein